ncbi:hypothetical protein CRENBAI_007599 [Crenichthys baileyi]|uniref:Uncharacterized protein n=1 Tax=Crenichthys baileyi TaxID=28760 RepID=A0AAV9RUL1_9TELE
MRWYLPTSLGGPYAHRCTEGPRASAGCQSMGRPKTPVTCPPPAQPGPQPGGNTPQEPSAPKSFPRKSAQEQPGHQASNLCPPVQPACSHKMPPQRSTKGPTPVGGHSPRRQIPRDPKPQGQPRNATKPGGPPPASATMPPQDEGPKDVRVVPDGCASARD